MGRVSAPQLGAIAVAAIGAVATTVAVSAAAMSARDAYKLIGLAAGTAIAGSVAAAVALRYLRGHSITSQTVTLTSIMLATVGLGAWAGAQAMFLSHHDLHVLVILITASGSVGLVSTLVLGDRIGRARSALLDATRRIGSGDPAVADSAAGHVVDTAELAEELARTGLRLDEARRRERAVDASRRELVAWISHDLRTPLAGLRAIAEALEDGVVDDTPRYYTLMRQETERLTTLVDDLFELSRTQSGVLQLEFQRVSLDDVVSDAIAGISPVADAKGVKVEGRIDGQIPECSASPSELLRALRNILENAVRHTPSDGTVLVEARAEEGVAVVSVIDDGGGIPDADLHNVFDAGFRGDRARSASAGAGLGLAIAKGIVEAHRGQLAVCNERGGARFTIRIPFGAQS